MSNNTIPDKPLTSRRLKARQLAQTAVQVLINENGTLTDIANRIPSLADNNFKRQSVSNRLQDKTVKEEIKAIVDEFDLAEFAKMTKRKLNAIVEHTPIDRPSAPQAALMTVGLKLTGDLIERQETKQSQTVDILSVRQMSKDDKMSLLLELIRLESAGIEVTVSPVVSETAEIK